MGWIRLVRWAAPLVVICAMLLPVLSPKVRDTALDLAGDDRKNALIGIYGQLIEQPADTADLVPMANIDINPYGINVFLEQEVEEWKIRLTLQMIRDGGFHWIKQEMLWSEIEIPSKGEYYDQKNNVNDTWRKYDRIVDLAPEYGLEVILRLDTSPAWARPGVEKEQTPPANISDYGDFVYKAVDRYKGRVKYFQIWNEPNLPFEWGGDLPNASEYVALLKVAYERAKEANPDCVIIAAALAPTIEASEKGINDLVFLQQMYDAGVAGYFDVMAANPYGLWSGPNDRRMAQDDVNFSRPVLTRQVMVRNGDATKPVWAAELGWSALPLDFPGEAPWGRVTRAQQASYTIAAYQRMREEWPWMGQASLWFFRMVHDVNRDKPQYYFGIVDNDFTPYPAYEAMKALTSEPPVVYRGFHQEFNWALNYSGGWRVQPDERAVLGGLMVANGPPDSLSFTFQGSDLDLVTRKDNTGGRLIVTIDGEGYGANRLARDGTGAAYADLWSEEPEWRQHLPVARGLPWGEHKVVIQVEQGPKGGSSAAIDGILVAGSRPNLPRLLGYLLASAVAGIALFGIWKLGSSTRPRQRSAT